MAKSCSDLHLATVSNNNEPEVPNNGVTQKIEEGISMGKNVAPGIRGRLEAIT